MEVGVKGFLIYYLNFPSEVTDFLGKNTGFSLSKDGVRKVGEYYFIRDCIRNVSGNPSAYQSLSNLLQRLKSNNSIVEYSELG
jgi:hypothetical protein